MKKETFQIWCTVIKEEACGKELREQKKDRKERETWVLGETSSERPVLIQIGEMNQF